MDEYPREPPSSSTSHAVCGATSEKRKRPVVGSTARERCPGGIPRARSSSSSCSRRASTARARSSSTEGSYGWANRTSRRLVARAPAPRARANLRGTRPLRPGGPMTTLAPELGTDMNADVRTLWFTDSLAEIHISTRDGDGAATLIELTLPEGHMTPLHVHDEDGSHYVLDGRVTFFVGDDVVEVQRGSTVLAPRGIPHTFRVDSPGARMLVTGARFEEFVRAASRDRKSVV